jgi:adenylosuccinate lyase
MPHKKNTILTENLCGLARIVRHNAGATLENIPTWSGRDISQSSVERIALVDSFHLVHFMIQRLTKVIEGLVVNEDRISENLHFTRGLIFSPDVNDFLLTCGYDTEQAYQLTQELAFKAGEEKRSYLEVILESGYVPVERQEELKNLFSVERKLRHIDAIFARFGL